MQEPPQRDRSQRRRRRVRRALAAACSLGMAVPAPLLAQTGGTETVPQPATTSGGVAAPAQAMTGEDFAGILYPQASVLGKVSLHGARVHDWTTGTARRITLEGDVRVGIAQFSFRAERACVWVQEIGKSPENRTVVQVFVYFDELGDASAATGQTAFTTSTLPVRAIVELDAPLTLTGDYLTADPIKPAKNSAAAKMMDAAKVAFVRSLRRAAGQPEEPEAAPKPQFSFTAPESGGQPKRWRAEVPGSGPSSATGAEGPAAAVPTAPKKEVGPKPELNPVPKPDTTPSVPGTPPTPPAKAPETAPPATPGTADTSSTLPAPAPVTQAPSTTSTPIPDSKPSQPRGEQPGMESPPIAPVQPAPAIASTDASVTQTSPTNGTLNGVATSAQPSRSLEPIFAKSGMITMASGDITLVPGKDENALTAVGGVTLMYRDLRGHSLQLSAQRVVVFLNASDNEASQLGAPISAQSVRGIYLEGDVTASDGTVNIRSPQVYYDLLNDKAVMLDAVFWTYSEERGVPLYVRAREIRQESARQWSAEHAEFTNSAFMFPELAIGASKVTIEQRQRVITDQGPVPGAAQSESYSWMKADHVTLKAAGLPFFYWPTYAGDPSQPILRDLRFENRSGSGLAVRSTWNAAQLLGIEAPQGTSIDLLTDAYVERGVAVGSRVRWNLARHQGALFGYLIPLDNGEDTLKPGTHISRDDDARGILTFEDRFILDRFWTITAEGSYISDEAFLDAFFEESGETRREFTNRLTATRREDNSVLGVELKTSFNDFVPNEWLLQSKGSTVSKLPEVSYARFADDLLPDLYPGLLTHFHEYRVGTYAFALDEVTARSRGFDTDFLSQKAFGISPDESIAQSLRARGYSEDPVTRLDTRQEVTAKLEAGPVHITPFVAVRATFYDNAFEEFSSRAGGNDSTRLWSSIGARASTTLTRVYDNIDSDVLDIHRLRHTVTPSVTLWAAGTNIEASDIPAYDPLVDSLADGQAVRIGVAQTLQTKRGGAGRWVDTDLLKLNTDIVLSTDDTEQGTPLGRFFDARPEYSAMGNFATADAAYRLTDATSIVASTVYDFDSHQQDMTSAGLMLTHAPGWSTLIDLRYINPQDSTILGLWGAYDLGDKYAVTLAPSYDAAEGNFQSAFVQFTRRFSAFQLSVGVTYNDITGETTFGLVLQPYGARRGAGMAGIGSTQFGDVYSGSSGL